VARDLETVARDNATTRADVIREAVNEYVSDYRDRLVFVRNGERCSCQ
jgi:metal-responsive CopG/Arc/MetJ family transcriptional regulator